MTTLQYRKIVHIDEDKCDGCGLCVPSCAEGAIQVIGGKARLVAENLCDGIGNCLGTCPRGAIQIEERPADAFDEVAVVAHLDRERSEHVTDKSPGACPSQLLKDLQGDPLPAGTGCPGSAAQTLRSEENGNDGSVATPSRLGHWPVQLTLVPEGGVMWNQADVLIAADCVAFAMGGFHAELLAGKSLAVACPKLDDIEPYLGKLARIFASNPIRSVTVVRMEVPCCMGLTRLVSQALQRAAREDLTLREIVISTRGEILADYPS